MLRNRLFASLNFFLLFACLSYAYSNKAHLPHFKTRHTSLRAAVQDADNGSKIFDDVLTSSDVSFLRIVAAQDEMLSPDEKPPHAADDQFSTENFGSIFQQCAPYIAMHRGTTVVVHIPGFCITNRDHFDAILDDISILHLLGVYICLIVGVREQLDAKIDQLGLSPNYHDGIRITDDMTMKMLMEASGSARFEIESSLARGFKGRPGQSGINVVSGNFLYSAKPLGVRNGIDFK